jgi:Putative lumazine-binding
MKKLTLLVFALLIVFPSYTFAQSDADKEAVRQAVLDYVEGVYNVAPERIERSVHPELVKRGFYIKKGETAYTFAPMTFTELVNLARTYNKNGRVPKDAPKEIVIFDVLDQTAAAKLTAVWGVDYFQLAKYDGKWKIVNILWQTPPPQPAVAAERPSNLVISR